MRCAPAPSVGVLVCVWAHTARLQRIREHIASNHRTLHRIVTAPSFRRAVGTLEGERLTRVPRGYLKDHPAAHYLQFKQYLAGREFKADFAVSDRFYAELLTVFRAVAPLVRFLNEGLSSRETRSRGA